MSEIINTNSVTVDTPWTDCTYLKTCGLVILLDFGMCNWTPFYSLQREMHVHKLRSATGSKSIVHCFRLHSYLLTQLSLTRIPFCNDLEMQHNENSSSGTMSYYVPYLHHSGMHRYYISSLRPSVIMTVFFLKKVMIYQFKKDRTYRRFRQHEEPRSIVSVRNPVFPGGVWPSRAELFVGRLLVRSRWLATGCGHISLEDTT